ncbi:FmdB family zinc ribbon protein [Leptolinea tardivitalis]|uniref:Putative regulatory protein FmdB zinc ribbon domain-containing protein n=1 Tax=Leptolinea tardivitalis TaxID=229920 RepID=A0A0P6WRM4_9CHLR|nr:FmdB family zinc ribbon protein [Leptolinea tardivitalis]KPL72767.1 hypothetical protein ADM99_06745 [Leptolinea tardivitalis]GAP20881.1 putative regulatory protein, FmdB family [Leptolinea tardivitalis]
MPSYDFICLDCRKRFEVSLSYSEYDSAVIRCQHCGSSNIRRKIGRIRIARNASDRMQSLADPTRLNSIDDDPQALGAMMRQMRSELGEEMPAEFDEVVDRLDHGQSPEQIDSAMPDLADNFSEGAGNSSVADDLDF